MKKKFLIFAVCFSSLTGFSQIVNVSTINELKLPATIDAGYVTLSPSGDYVLVTDFGRNGLQKVDLATGNLTEITKAPGAGYDVKFSDDGSTIVFRETTYNKKHLKETSLKTKNLKTLEEKTILSSTRDLEGVAFQDGKVTSINKGKSQSKQLFKTNGIKSEGPVMSIKNGHLMMTLNGKTKIFDPNGSKVRYIWPSVSPDQKHIVYYVSGLGAYVCDINGHNVTALGTLRAPKWYNSDVVVGMEDVDGEYDAVKSSIIATTIDGKTRQTLTNDSTIAMYPTVSNKGDKILFSTPNGKAYIININLNN